LEPAFADLVAGLPGASLEYVAWSGGQKKEFDEVIITPYVVPTVLAALWAVSRFPTSWAEALAAAIGLGGDVDTLGAIVGGLMGARLGESALPAHLAQGVLDADRLRRLALRYAALIDRLTGP
jgi:ADP-ribosylglycohydrolase